MEICEMYSFCESDLGGLNSGRTVDMDVQMRIGQLDKKKPNEDWIKLFFFFWYNIRNMLIWIDIFLILLKEIKKKHCNLLNIYC